jgi:hypothetical protein
MMGNGLFVGHVVMWQLAVEVGSLECGGVQACVLGKVLTWIKNMDQNNQ